MSLILNTCAQISEDEDKNESLVCRPCAVKLLDAFNMRLLMRNLEEEHFAPIRRIQLKPFESTLKQSFDDYIQKTKIEMDQLRKEKHEVEEKLRKALVEIDYMKQGDETPVYDVHVQDLKRFQIAKRKCHDFWQCLKCNYKSKKLHKVREHFESVHLMIRNFFCDLCEYKSYKRKNISRHMKVHLKPFECASNSRMKKELKAGQSQR
jgi:hypothetical protein